MNKSESIGAIAWALSKAQAEIEPILKDKKNTHFKYSYLDIGSVIAAIKEPLSKYDLSFTQMPYNDEGGKLGVETLVMHKSGEWISSRFSMDLPKKDAQGYGSAITYCRKYALQAVFSCSGEDDDGQGANKPAKKTSGIEGMQLKIKLKERCDKMVDAFSSIDVTKPQILGFLKIKSFEEVSLEQVDELAASFKMISSGDCSAADIFEAIA